MGQHLGEYIKLEREMRLRLVITSLHDGQHHWACLCVDFHPYRTAWGNASAIWQLQTLMGGTDKGPPSLDATAAWHPLPKKRGHVVISANGGLMYYLGRGQ